MKADIRNPTTGTGAIVQPNAQILAEGGPISIGENTIIEEFAVIINR
jgi:serine acetyltransferase